jgi:hypothetical protein
MRPAQNGSTAALFNQILGGHSVQRLGAPSDLFDIREDIFDLT